MGLNINHEVLHRLARVCRKGMVNATSFIHQKDDYVEATDGKVLLRVKGSKFDGERLIERKKTASGREWGVREAQPNEFYPNTEEKFQAVKSKKTKFKIKLGRQVLINLLSALEKDDVVEFYFKGTNETVYFKVNGDTEGMICPVCWYPERSNEKC